MEDTLGKVIEVKRKIEKLLNSASSSKTAVKSKKAVKYLKALKCCDVSLKVLTVTNIGMTVNNLRKCIDNAEVRELGRALLKKWKKLLDKPVDRQVEDGTSSTRHGGQSSPLKKSTTRKREHKDDSKSHWKLKLDGQEESVTKKKGKGLHKPKPEVERGQGSGISVGARTPFALETSESSVKNNTLVDSNSDVRVKCRKLLAGALFADGHCPEGCSNVQRLAEQLETCIFKEFKNTDFKYKCRIRSRISNLKDPKNPTLRTMFLVGEISPAQLAKMTAEEMASEELKSLRAQFAEESIQNVQLVSEEATNTELLKCPKCRKRNCTYNQLQTLSSDEPMTTFVLCNDCDHRWMFY